MMEVLGYLLLGVFVFFAVGLVILAALIKISFKRRREDRGL